MDWKEPKPKRGWVYARLYDEISLTVAEQNLFTAHRADLASTIEVMITSYEHTASCAFVGAPVIFFVSKTDSIQNNAITLHLGAAATFQMRDILAAERTFSPAMESACLEIIIHVLSPRFCVRLEQLQRYRCLTSATWATYTAAAFYRLVKYLC